MLLALLADFVLIVHLCFILFAVFGGLLVLYKRWIAWLHVPSVVWAAVVNMTPWLCPLTPWENYLRRLAGEDGYEGGFISHYLAPLVYPGELSASVIIGMAAALLAWNAVIYIYVLLRT